MPSAARFLTTAGHIEVAALIGLSTAIVRGLRRHHVLTAIELADLSYWGRTPRSSLGQQWRANVSMRSATRRALARLRRTGQIIVIDRVGRAFVYGLAAEVPRP